MAPVVRVVLCNTLIQPGILTAPNKRKSNFQITQNDPNFEK